MALSTSQNQLVACFLHLLNLVFAVAGIALAVGILVAYLMQLNGRLSAASSPSMLWVLIVLGLFITCTALLGCCGLCLQNKCFLSLYAAIVTAIFVVQLVLAIMIYKQSLALDAFWQQVGDSTGVPIYGVMFIMCAI